MFSQGPQKFISVKKPSSSVIPKCLANFVSRNFFVWGSRSCFFTSQESVNMLVHWRCSRSYLFVLHAYDVLCVNTCVCVCVNVRVHKCHGIHPRVLSMCVCKRVCEWERQRWEKKLQGSMLLYLFSFLSFYLFFSPVFSSDSTKFTRNFVWVCFVLVCMSMLVSKNDVPLSLHTLPLSLSSSSWMRLVYHRPSCTFTHNAYRRSPCILFVLSRHLSPPSSSSIGKNRRWRFFCFSLSKKQKLEKKFLMLKFLLLYQV